MTTAKRSLAITFAEICAATYYAAIKNNAATMKLDDIYSDLLPVGLAGLIATFFARPRPRADADPTQRDAASVSHLLDGCARGQG
jgi:hypothetical protein